MPQLSLETYVTQYFWLVAILFTFYYVAVTQIIPKFSEIIKTRKKVESLGTSSSLQEESSTSKQGSQLVTKSIATSKQIKAAKYDVSPLQKHFKEANNSWINKTLS